MRWQLIAREAWGEFRWGMRSGIASLIFVGLIAYLLVSLANADYVQKMGATDIPRNAPSLIYLMSTGCMFFLFFAWAWVFAQPVLRDRAACLQEVVLATPNPLPALLWGRFIGAALVGAVLGGSVVAGFLVTPLLQWLGAVPAGSIGPMPWRAMAFAWLWLMVPAGTGIGALYFLVTLRTRGVAAAFGLSALLMLLWMFAVVVLKGGQINPLLAAVLDPSLFTFAHAQVETWTPAQKSSALLPLSAGFLFNRVLWAVLPLLMLAWAIHRLQRETLVLETPPKRAKPPIAEVKKTPETALPGASTATRWLAALRLETVWQLRRVLRSRVWWGGAGVLLAMGLLSAFIHGVWHAEGPMVPRPELLLPLLKDAIFLVIAFVVAALVGLVARRDDVPGFDAMFDAAPAPDYVRLLGRALTVVAVTLLLALLPGVSGLLATALAAPAAFDAATALLYQLLVMAPALLELALAALLIHALVRRAGVAYAASMLLTFVLVLNHELELVDYPPYMLGIPAKLSLSALTGWSPWLDYLLALDAYKLAGCLLLVAAAGLLWPRGLDSRWRAGLALARGRLAGPQGAMALAAIMALVGLGSLLERKLVDEGHYHSSAEALQEAAEWERQTLRDAAPFAVAGGALRLDVDLAARTLEGTWRLHGVSSRGGRLHAELPEGFVLRDALVDGREVGAELQNDHLVVPLGSCAATGCDVQLQWRLAPSGWAAEGEPAWLSRGGLWLSAVDAVPRLGLDPERLLRVPADRERLGLPREFGLPEAGAAVASGAVAPAAEWRWVVRVAGAAGPEGREGRTHGPLNFALAWAPRLLQTEAAGVRIRHDGSRAAAAHAVAEDVAAMRACVARRLGIEPAVREVVQWPRGLGATQLGGGVLQLAEAPYWDVADAGVGRWMRRAAIAEAMARRHLVDAGDLRSAAGTQWLSEGVAGAVGLLCVGDADGMAALNQVMARYSETTTRALAGSTVPVGPLALARQDGWVRHYAPLAALDWTVQQSPAEFAALLAELRQGRGVAEGLAARMGEGSAREALGAPLATHLALQHEGDRLRIDGARWQWRGGGWQPLAEKPQYRLLTRVNGVIRLEIPEDTALGTLPRQPAPSLLLDAWPSYTRAPAGNLVGEPGERRG